MSSTIMLAHRYDGKHNQFPCVLNEKLDGVAVDIFGELFVDDKLEPHIAHMNRSRQGKCIPSIDNLCAQMDSAELLRQGQHIIGELYIPGSSFKDISGEVRRQEPSLFLELFIYDFYELGKENTDFLQRMKVLSEIFERTKEHPVWKRVHLPKYPYICNSEDTLQMCISGFKESNPRAEGLVMRHLKGPSSWYKQTRSWGMQKIKFRETVDLRVIGIEEAIQADGTPNGMLGRINCEYKGWSIGVSPGSMLHSDRVKCWDNPGLIVGKIIEVQYMPDPSYNALREPQFKRIRDDKDEPNEE